MKLSHPFRLTVAAVSLLAVSVRADTLYFQAQSPTLDLWSSVLNWYVMDGMGHLVPAGRIPIATDIAIVAGKADAQASVTELNTLILQPFAEVDNGAFIVQTLQMGGFSFFSGSSVTVDVEMDVLGQGCGLNTTTLIINPGAFAFLSVSNQSRLNLGSGALIQNNGDFILVDNTGMQSGGAAGTTNKFENRPGATFRSSGNAFFSGVSGAGIFDNSGTVQADSGTLSFTGLSPALTWACTNGTGTFNTVVSNAMVVFNGPLNVDPGVTFLFTGPGTNNIAFGTTVQGTLQVGAVDSQTSLFIPGNLATTSGTIQGPGLVHVLASNNVASTLTSTSPQITTTTITIDANAWFNIITYASMVSNVVNNSGMTRWTGAGDISLGGGAAFNNLPGGTFEMRNDRQIAGQGAFNNAGTVRKTMGTGITSLGNYDFRYSFNNSGLLDVQTGTVNIYFGTGNGQFNTAGGTVLSFAGGTNTLNNGASFTGSGSFRVNAVNPDLLVVNGNVALPNLELGNGATIDGPGQLAVNGPFSWDNGTIQGSGTLILSGPTTVNTGGTLNQRTINNSGTVTWAGSGGITAANGAVFNNLSGAVFDLQNDASFGNGGGTQPVFNNAGTFRKSAGVGTTEFSVNFNNSGSVLVNTQTVWFFASYQQTAGTTVVNQGATIRGNVLNIQGGTLGGAGTINAAVNNASGVVSPGMSPGLLTISGGNAYTQSVAGTLSIDLGGLTVGTQYDQLAVTGPVSLAGELNVSLVNGFVPSPGEQFTILTCASRNGTFPVKNGTYLGNSLALIPLYSNTNVVLVVSNVTVLQPLIGFARTGAQGNSFQLTWPSVFGQPHQVEFSSNLFQWFVLSNFTAVGTNANVIDPTPIPGVPQRFYRLR